ncbi:non-ribosomal peptide synthetase [Aquimarina latercula]|uniref:non-ribosomal peptide synthetase n=1 Tax=Aquimarina latercula TaxID=987 RepID=UPI00040DE168|nr:non-ribosomal peptide synthetase [Aquimarina latercula]
MIDNLINTLESLNVGLKVDNGNIKINAPKGTLSAEIIEDIKAHKDQLIKLLSSSEAIPVSEKKEFYELTSSQRRLWALSQLEDGNIAYNIFDAFKFSGIVDIDKLSVAFLKLIERHESLRTIFKEDVNGELGQYIIPVEQYLGRLKFLDVSNTGSEELLKKHSKTVKEHVFNLEKGPLFIGEVVKISDQEHILMLNMHHIIGDGWSMVVLSREFISIYNSLVSGKTITLQPLSIQYKDYAEWENSTSKQLELERSKSFWLDKFKGDLPILELPTSKIRPKIKTYNGSDITYSFSKETTSRLNQYAQQNEVTLFMVLMAGVNGLFSRYTNTGDIILGTPVAGREHADLENQVGLYLNTLAIRTEFERTSSFKDLVSIQKNTLLDAYSHQEYPFDNLLDDLTITRDISRSALFDVMVVLQNQQELFASDNLHLNGIEISRYRNTQASFSKFDISFIFSEKKGRLSVNIEYNTDVYEVDFIQRLCVHLDNFLTEGINNPNQEVATLNYLEASEEALLFYDFNDTSFNIPDTSIVDLFVTQAAKTPESIAVVHESKEFTYRELDEVSNELAHYLLDQYDLKIEELVGVKLDRSEWLIVSLLAVLKAGAAYVPIDPSYPTQRISYIEEDSKCKVTIDENLLEEFNKQEEILKTLPNIRIKPSNLAYVIYTSGSTGKPKGVMIEHRSLSNLCSWHISEYNLDASSRGSLYAGIGFDASVWEIYPYLVSGGSLFPISNQEVRYDINLLIEFLRDHKITHTYLPTKICEEIVIQGFVLGDVKILTGGEALKLPENSYDLKIYNNYGPSENTVVTTSFDLTDRSGESIPIGRPIANTKIYILSENLELQPIGVAGEICISGKGLSRGYLNRPELTEEKFIDNPFIKETRLYKTGDLGSWSPDGTIEFIGRIDNQVKIRGYRIELGEIEQVLLGIRSVHQAVIVDCEVEKEKVLVAYVVGNEDIDKQALRVGLSNELPEYMVPNYYVEIDELPLTSNGKVDKKALPEITNQDLVKEEYVAPVSEEEKELVRIWQEVLGIENIGVTDNFFGLGGHSLKMMILINKINQKFNIEITAGELYSNMTILRLSKLLKSKKPIDFNEITPIQSQKDGYMMSNEQLRMWLASRTGSGSKAYNIETVYKIEGKFDVEIFKKSVQYLLDRHEALRTSFATNKKGDVVQYISDYMDVNSVITYISQDQLITGSDIDEFLKSFSHFVFDLDKSPLFRVLLIQKNKEEYILSYMMHHIIGDFSSDAILNKELAYVYDQIHNGKDIELPKLQVQYKDYVKWIKNRINNNEFKAQSEFWKAHLQNVKQEKKWHKEVAIDDFRGAHFTETFDKKIIDNIEEYCKSNDRGLMSLIASALGVLIHKTSGQKDILISVPISLRNHPDLMNQVGLYLNLMPYNVHINPFDKIEELLQKSSDNQINMIDSSFYPFDAILDDFQSLNGFNLVDRIDVCLNVINQNQESSNGGGFEKFKFKVQSQELKKSKFPICFYIYQEENKISYTIEYQTAVFDHKEVSILAKRFCKCVEFLLKNSEKEINTINLIDKKTIPVFGI